MRPLRSHAPRLALSEHPEFAFMLLLTLERFHCTLAEVREDYWLGRAWRALAEDPALAGRVARVGVSNVLIMGPRFGAAPAAPGERARWARRVEQRLMADTGRTPARLGMTISFAEQAVEVAPGTVRSLLAQALVGDPRWDDLTPYVGDLTPITVPVAHGLLVVIAA